MAQDIFDLIPDSKFKLYQETVTLFVEDWERAPIDHHDWRKVSFPPESRADIPREPGVYVFVIEQELFGFPKYGLLAYVGKATSLYNRIGAYISDVGLPEDQASRPAVWRLLNQWEGYTSYYFTVTETVDLAEQLEDNMIAAMRPPFNRKYPSSISRTQRMF